MLEKGTKLQCDSGVSAGTGMTPGSGILSGTRRSLSRRRIQERRRRRRVRTRTTKILRQWQAQMGPWRSVRKVSTGGPWGQGMLKRCLLLGTQIKGFGLLALVG